MPERVSGGCKERGPLSRLQVRTFSGRSGDEKPFDALVGESGEVVPVRVEVKFTGPSERCYERREEARVSGHS